MSRFCYLFELLDGVEEDYQRAHEEISDAVPAAMREAGITTYSLFRRGSLVIAVGECAGDVEETFARLDRNPDNRAWSASIRTLMHDPLEPDGSLRFAPEIWRLPAAD
ncbi:MAG: L-rhamnose mutarotase [Actinomycetota bacterium]